MVFQNHSLLPWLTVYQNVEIAVDKIFRAHAQRARSAREWILHNLAMVNMSHALDRLPSEISGGMKQRVGIARALAMEPKVLLLDEPFGALDALTRAHLQDEVIRIQSELGNTVMMITHDVDEAVLLSDRVVMMTNGPAATIGQVLDVRPAAPAQPHRAGRRHGLQPLPPGDPELPVREAAQGGADRRAARGRQRCRADAGAACVVPPWCAARWCAGPADKPSSLARGEGQGEKHDGAFSLAQPLHSSSSSIPWRVN